jgi:hypothetical protein
VAWPADGATKSVSTCALTVEQARRTLLKVGTGLDSASRAKAAKGAGTPRRCEARAIAASKCIAILQVLVLEKLRNGSNLELPVLLHFHSRFVYMARQTQLKLSTPKLKTLGPVETCVSPMAITFLCCT